MLLSACVSQKCIVGPVTRSRALDLKRFLGDLIEPLLVPVGGCSGKASFLKRAVIPRWHDK